MLILSSSAPSLWVRNLRGLRQSLDFWDSLGYLCWLPLCLNWYLSYPLTLTPGNPD